jgi:hypothetical protein
MNGPSGKEWGSYQKDNMMKYNFARKTRPRSNPRGRRERNWKGRSATPPKNRTINFGGGGGGHVAGADFINPCQYPDRKTNPIPDR